MHATNSAPVEGEAGETSLKVSKGKERSTAQLFLSPEFVLDVILGADFLPKNKAVLNFAEGTFKAQQYKEANSVISCSKRDTDEICSALFEAAGIVVDNLDELCAQLTYITDSERKDLHSLPSRHSNMSA